ncbi:hypothetical protein [Saccharopolyspora mangrovi]|uniref:hypothetical protein n=1 Tax=Saccharopolyspora mangrovi TaxID=3082379 RepID=UPI002B4BCCA2|nr:hypothetical protein [Saccharopolyspora sp. S2-29]
MKEQRTDTREFDQLRAAINRVRQQRKNDLDEVGEYEIKNCARPGVGLDLPSNSVQHVIFRNTQHLPRSLPRNSRTWSEQNRSEVREMPELEFRSGQIDVK